MFRIAVIQFPGTNCEHETKRSLENAGLQAELVRWNERDGLDQYDGYVLPGGFAYEDRSRAGIVAAQDPIMDIIKQEAHKGKPVIGICNGCQILVETGLVPGLDNDTLAGAVMVNTRVKEGEIIGTGFYHDQVYLKNVAQTGRSCVTMDIPQGATVPASVANGEGRFVFPNDLLLELEKHDQILFKYCTSDGTVLNDFPTNPNGSEWGIAGLCNREGNVVAYMPHPERQDTGVPLFESLREYLETNPTPKPYDIDWTPPESVVETYTPSPEAIQLYVGLKITDNAANTVELVLQQEGFGVQVSRQTHWEIWHSAGQDQVTGVVDTIIQSGEILNTNKETYTTEFTQPSQSVSLLVRFADDYEGKAVSATLQNRFDLTQINNIQKGELWTLHFPNEPVEQKRLEQAIKILQTYILYNPYAQECLLVK